MTAKDDKIDKITKAVELLMTESPLAQHRAGVALHELAAVFVAAAEMRRLERELANQSTVDHYDAEKVARVIRHGMKAADALDAALQRAAEKVLA